MSGILPPESSASAASAIRRFSMLTWMIGTIVVGLITAVAFPRVGINPNTGALVIGDEAGYATDYAWLADDPRELQVVDGEVEGTADGGYVRVDGGSDILALTLASGARDDWISVSYQEGTQIDTAADDWSFPSFLGSLSARDVTIVVPADTDGLLWFSGATADWSATVEVPETTPVTGTLSGRGNAVLVYEGDALSGTFTHEGTGIFIVGGTTTSGWDLLVNDSDDVSTRASWDATDRIVFDILADTGDGTWTVTLDTPGSASGPASGSASDPPSDPADDAAATGTADDRPDRADETDQTPQTPTEETP